MKILWIVNTLFPYPCEKLGYKKNVFGGWLLGLFNSLEKEKNIKLAVATTYTGSEYLVFEDNNTKYYLLPCKNNLKYDKLLEKYWQEVVKDFYPDLVHIHGTEYANGLTFQRTFPDIKTVTSIQGLIGICSNYYIANINIFDIYKNITLRDVLKNDSILSQQRNFNKRSYYEMQMIKNSHAIIGRTEWDYANTLAITKTDKYYKCNESLRDSFYEKEWNIANINKHTIFFSQAGYPLKGFHIMLEAAMILKTKYPDIKIYVAGHNILDSSNIKLKLKRTGYAKYLFSLIKKYNLEDIVCFTGLLTEEEMADKMCQSHIFVQASSIENSPNSLGEAMILGMPCVASNVGGTSTMLKDKEEGFLYPFGDYGLLSYYINQIFDNDNLAINIGQKAKKHAYITHDREKNVLDMIKIYKEIINKGSRDTR